MILEIYTWAPLEKNLPNSFWAVLKAEIDKIDKALYEWCLVALATGI